MSATTVLIVEDAPTQAAVLAAVLADYRRAAGLASGVGRDGLSICGDMVARVKAQRRRPLASVDGVCYACEWPAPDA